MTPEATRAGVKAATAAAAPVVARPGALAAPPSRSLSARVRSEWMPLAAWKLQRTGRLGMLGVALLFAAALFFFSTHSRVAAEADSLRGDLAAAHSSARAAPAVEAAADPAAALRTLPARGEMPEILRQLFAKAGQAGLAVETGKYEVSSSASGRVVRTQVAFPVAGPYPQIRSFIDATLSAMPFVALSDLVLDRKAIGDGTVEAQLRMTVFTRSAP